MVCNSEIKEEVENDEEDDYGTIGANDKCLEKPTPITIRSVIKTIVDFSFFPESEEMQGCTIKV